MHPHIIDVGGRGQQFLDPPPLTLEHFMRAALRILDTNHVNQSRLGVGKTAI